MKFRVMEGNASDEKVLLVITEDDLLNERAHRVPDGKTWDILIIPNKYKHASNDTIDFLKKVTGFIEGSRIIYV